MTMTCDRLSGCFDRKEAESGGRAPMRPLDAPKQPLYRPLYTDASRFVADRRCVVRHDALASLRSNALSVSKNSRVSANAIYEFTP